MHAFFFNSLMSLGVVSIIQIMNFCNKILDIVCYIYMFYSMRGFNDIAYIVYNTATKAINNVTDNTTNGLQKIPGYVTNQQLQMMNNYQHHQLYNNQQQQDQQRQQYYNQMQSEAVRRHQHLFGNMTQRHVIHQYHTQQLQQPISSYNSFPPQYSSQTELIQRNELRPTTGGRRTRSVSDPPMLRTSWSNNNNNNTNNNSNNSNNLQVHQEYNSYMLHQQSLTPQSSMDNKKQQPHIHTTTPPHLQTQPIPDLSQHSSGNNLSSHRSLSPTLEHESNRSNNNGIMNHSNKGMFFNNIG